MHAARPANRKVLLHALEVDVTSDFRIIALQIKPNIFSILPQILAFQVMLVLKQMPTHGPELALRSRRFRSLRRHFRMRMDFDDWKVPEDKSDSMLKLLQQDTDRAIRLRAQRGIQSRCTQRARLQPSSARGRDQRIQSEGQRIRGCSSVFLSPGASERGVDEVFRQEPDLQFVGT